jgi:2-polyprenyl-3-methyl-5-hydroxy-6-metoxy-1,4-benzoquinol methylase
MVIDEHFVPEHGLELDPYIARGDVGAVHHLIRYKWALACLDDLRPASVLDVACGAGYGSYAIAKEFPFVKVFGVDYDPSAVNQSRSSYAMSNLRFAVGDLMRWDETIGDDVFDCVITFDTIEHVPHRELMMDNLVRHLTPNGSVLLSTPCARPENALVPEWEHHKLEYNAASLYDFLRRYFRVVQRRDDATLPHADVFNRLRGTDINYAPVMNPVLCRGPILIENPYRPHQCPGRMREEPR